MLEPAASRADLQAGATAFLSSLLSRPANQEVRLAKANPALISAETRELVISISDKEWVTFQQRGFDVTESVVQDMQGAEVKKIMQVWYGDVASDRKQRFSGPEEVDTDPFNNAMIVRDGEKLVGNVRVAGQAYRLEALENGKYALIKVDESKLLPEGEPLIAPADVQQGGVALPKPESAHSVINVMVVTTNQSRAARPNHYADIQLMVSHANQVNINSGVAITFGLGFFNATYDEDDKTNGAMLSELSSPGSELGAFVAHYRQVHYADLVSMIIVRYEHCGLGYVNASRTSAFSTVTCDGSFAHELGHNLGANHDWEPGQPATNPLYANGYRYYGINPRFRTQMAYDCPNTSCPKIDYWSTPLKAYQGIPVGTASRNDNVRRFNERREYVEGFY